VKLFSCKKYIEWINLIVEQDKILNDALESFDVDLIYQGQESLDQATEPRDLEFWGALEKKYEFKEFHSGDGDIQLLQNGAIAYSGFNEFAIRILNPYTGEIIKDLAGEDGKSEDVRSICELGFGFILGGGYGGALLIWGPQGKCDKGPKMIRNSIYEIIFDNESGYFFSGESHTGKVRVWDINKAGEGMQEMNFRTFQTIPYDNENEAFDKHPGTISSLVYLGNGIIVGAGYDAGINFWDLNSDSNLPVERILDVARGGGHLLLMNDGTLIHYSKNIAIVDPINHRIIKNFGPSIDRWISSVIEIEPGILAVSDDQKNITFWQKNNGQCLGTVKTDGNPDTLCTFPGGLVVGFGDQRVQVWGRSQT